MLAFWDGKSSSGMGLGFFNLTLIQRHWDMMLFCMQLGNAHPLPLIFCLLNPSFTPR